jgi:hypothetical protein
VKNLGDDYT